jgi:hypothetical protein
MVMHPNQQLLIKLKPFNYNIILDIFYLFNNIIKNNVPPPIIIYGRFLTVPEAVDIPPENISKILGAIPIPKGSIIDELGIPGIPPLVFKVSKKLNVI